MASPQVSSRDRCVYAHHRNDNGKIFYIGRGTYDRAHSSDCRAEGWWGEARGAGGFTPEILEGGLTAPQAMDLEAMMIMHYGRKIDGGVLCNVALGSGPQHPNKVNGWRLPLGGNVRARNRRKVLDLTSASGATIGEVMDDAIKLLEKALNQESSSILVTRLREKYRNRATAKDPE